LWAPGTNVSVRKRIPAHFRNSATRTDPVLRIAATESFREHFFDPRVAFHNAERHDRDVVAEKEKQLNSYASMMAHYNANMLL
jgi:hypothetical protein